MDKNSKAEETEKVSQYDEWENVTNIVRKNDSSRVSTPPRRLALVLDDIKNTKNSKDVDSICTPILLPPPILHCSPPPSTITTNTSLSAPSTRVGFPMLSLSYSSQSDAHTHADQTDGDTTSKIEANIVLSQRKDNTITGFGEDCHKRYSDHRYHASMPPTYIHHQVRSSSRQQYPQQHPNNMQFIDADERANIDNRSRHYHSTRESNNGDNYPGNYHHFCYLEQRLEDLQRQGQELSARNYSNCRSTHFMSSSCSQYPPQAFIHETMQQPPRCQSHRTSIPLLPPPGSFHHHTSTAYDVHAQHNSFRFPPNQTSFHLGTSNTLSKPSYMYHNQYHQNKAPLYPKSPLDYSLPAIDAVSSHSFLRPSEDCQNVAPKPENHNCHVNNNVHMVSSSHVSRHHQQQPYLTSSPSSSAHQECSTQPNGKDQLYSTDRKTRSSVALEKGADETNTLSSSISTTLPPLDTCGDNAQQTEVPEEEQPKKQTKKKESTSTKTQKRKRVKREEKQVQEAPSKKNDESKKKKRMRRPQKRFSVHEFPPRSSTLNEDNKKGRPSKRRRWSSVNNEKMLKSFSQHINDDEDLYFVSSISSSSSTIDNKECASLSKRQHDSSPTTGNTAVDCQDGVKRRIPLTTNIPRRVKCIPFSHCNSQKESKEERIFESCSEAARQMNINRTRLSRSKYNDPLQPNINFFNVVSTTFA